MEVERATAAAEMAVDHAGAVEKPRFDALMPSEMSGGRPQFRKVPVPPHRFSPLKRCWMEIYTPVYEHMKVDIRMNIKVKGSPSQRVTFEHKKPGSHRRLNSELVICAIASYYAW
jgi:RNA-binding protein PNO1